MAAMGVATLMNLIETYVSPTATAETQALSLAGIPIVMDNITKATAGTGMWWLCIHGLA